MIHKIMNGFGLAFSILVLGLILVGCGKSYTVSFSVDGEVTTEKTAKDGSFSMIEEPVKEGYHFVGWYLDSDLKTAYQGEAVKKDITLYAKFLLILKVEATTSAGGSAEVTIAPDKALVEGDTAIFSATAEDGYAFAGWYLGDELQSAENPYALVIEKDTTLEARFSATEYPITYENLFDALNHNPATYTIADTVTLLKPSGRAGYTFIGWVDASGATVTTIGPGARGAIALTAMWEETGCTTVTASNGAYGSYYASSVIARASWDCGIDYWNDQGHSASSTGSEYNVDGYTGISEAKESGVFYDQNVNVLTVPCSTDITIVPWAKNTGGAWSFNTVRNNIIDFEQRNPGYKAIAAVNGSAFDIRASWNFARQPAGVLISQGNVYSATVDGYSVLGYKNDGSTSSLLMSETSNYTFSDYYLLDVLDSDGNVLSSFKIPTYNAEAASGSSTVWFGVFNDSQKYVPAETSANASGMKTYYVSSGEDDAILPNDADDFYGLGSITAIYEAAGDVIPMITRNNAFTIQTYDPQIQAALSMGSRVRVQREIIGDYAGANALGTFGTLLINNEYSGAGVPTGRNPRTMVGIREDGTLVFVVVDGRQGGNNMYGTDEYETAAILSAYGCIGGYNLDGGGSATMVIRDDTISSGFRCVNYPSDGHERSDSTCIIIAIKQPEITLSTSSLTQTSATIKQVVTDPNGLTYKALYAQIVGREEKVKYDDAGEATFTGLSANTAYNYILWLDCGEGKLRQLYYTGTFKTLKTVPENIVFSLAEDDTNWIFSLSADDPDGAIVIMNILLGSKHGYMKNGKLALAKTRFTEEEARSATCEVTYILAEGVESVTMTLNLSS